MEYYNYQERPIFIARIKTSRTELWHLVKAWLTISLAFAIVLSGGFRGVFSPQLFTNVLFAAVTVGIGFLLHELAHKLVAQKYRCWAEFRSFDQFLVMTLLMSFFGFVFAAPGAVFIRGHVTERKNGIISVAGPATNLVLASIFLFSLAFLPIPAAALLFSYGFMINTWLALFNMLPFGNFDGIKILRWNKLAYGMVVAVSVVFMLLLYA